mmetsp:Transcript_1066/g.4531  ORF Transcript_1066/g.4531 Transcript_1066/m.4531 type:complete len:381 (-) Transcript_1066:418-1560(-)
MPISSPCTRIALYSPAEQQDVLREPHERPEAPAHHDQLDLVLLEHRVEHALELIRGQTLHGLAHRRLNLERPILVLVRHRDAPRQLVHQILRDLLPHPRVRVRAEHHLHRPRALADGDVREPARVALHQLAKLLPQTTEHHLLPEVLRVAEELHVELAELLAHLVLALQERPLQGAATHPRGVDGAKDQFQREPVCRVSNHESKHREQRPGERGRQRVDAVERDHLHDAEREPEVEPAVFDDSKLGLAHLLEHPDDVLLVRQRESDHHRLQVEHLVHVVLEILDDIREEVLGARHGLLDQSSLDLWGHGVPERGRLLGHHVRDDPAHGRVHLRRQRLGELDRHDLTEHLLHVQQLRGHQIAQDRRHLARLGGDDPLPPAQ